MTAEFTGERVIPGQVDTDLWNEHLSRYLFARRFAAGKRVLDAGCGAGYGSAELMQVAQSVTSIDIASTAVLHAASHHAGPRYVQASCSTLPFASESFDLIVMYEVIEHVKDWPSVLSESRRVLTANGHLIVSTPNKEFYSETRDEPNPFHEHEFEYREFRDALQQQFAHVTIFLEDHAQSVVFRGSGIGGEEVLVGETDFRPESSSFFVAVCGSSPALPASTFVYVPSAANMLGEKLKHIRALESEIKTKDAWIAQEQDAHQELLRKHAEQLAELEKSNRWAQQMEVEVEAARGGFQEVRQELEQAVVRTAQAYEEQIDLLNRTLQERTDWLRDVEQRLTEQLTACAEDRDRQTAELATCVELLHQTEATLEERTQWAARINEENMRLQAAVDAARASRWIRLGRAIGLGPELHGN